MTTKARVFIFNHHKILKKEKKKQKKKNHYKVRLLFYDVSATMAI